MCHTAHHLNGEAEKRCKFSTLLLSFVHFSCISLNSLSSSTKNMGCSLCKGREYDARRASKRAERVEQSSVKEKRSSIKKEYSWDKKQKANLKDFMIENVKEETVSKYPGSINGQQFIIQNCENCNIYLLDHINTITIDDCTNCNIVIGPTKGSVFIRTCKDCRVLVACQQFRTRDCQRIDTILCSTTHPIIESSSGMKFSCYSYSYSELESHFRNANLSVFNNDWADVRDFTPVEGEMNWSLLSLTSTLDDIIPLPPSNEDHPTIKPSYDNSIVPHTYGTNQKSSNESCLVVFFNDGHSHLRSMTYINDMKRNWPNTLLLRTKEIKMNVSDAKRVLHTDSYSSVAERGPVIGLEYNGDGSIQACQKTAMEIATATGSTGLVYVGSNLKTINSQIKEFFDLTDMQMSV